MRKANLEQRTVLAIPDRPVAGARRRPRSRSRSSEMEKPEDRPTAKTAIAKQMMKRRRALKRQKRDVKRLRAAVGERGVLEDKSLSAETRKDYSRRLERFWDFVARFSLPTTRLEDLDVALVDHSDWLYLDGDSCDAGTKLKSAIEAFHVEYLRLGRLHLPRFNRTLKGWRKAAPTRVRKVLPEEPMYAVCGALLYGKKRDMALLTVLDYSAYLRPSEGLGLLAVDVVPEVAASSSRMNYVAVILAPIEREVSTKTGFYDESVVLDSVREPFLGPLLVELAARRRQEAGGDECARIWDFTPSAYLTAFKSAAQQLKLEKLVESPYQCRRGGPSRDRLMKLRTLAEIKKRGRWATDSSVRIYEKAGRTQQTLHGVPESLIKYGNDVRMNFARYSRDGTCPRPPLPRKGSV